jgi:hypothetical protein
MKKNITVAAKRKQIFKEQKLTIGMDLGDRFTYYCVLEEAGELVCSFRRKPDYRSRFLAVTYRAAASALSSDRVLRAIAAPGPALRIELMTTSKSARWRGGRRTPPPMTTQS